MLFTALIVSLGYLWFGVQQTWCLFHFPFWRVKIRGVPKPIILQQCLALIKICHYT